MSTILDALVKHGAMLATGATLLLFTGVVAMWLVGTPARQQRLGEAVLAGTLLFVALALIPLPRWTSRSASNARTFAAGASPSAELSPAARTESEDSLLATSADARRTGYDADRVASETAETSRRAPVPARNAIPQKPASVAPPRAGVNEIPNVNRPEPSPGAGSLPLPIAQPKTDEAINAVATSPVADKPTDGWGRWLAAGYLACAGLCTLWLAAGYCVLRRTLRRARPADGWLAEMYAGLPWDGTLSKPALYVSADLPRPVCYGWWQAVIVAPKRDCRVELREQLRHVLLHELAHAEHRDGASRALACISLPVLYFHPLYWLLRRRIEFATEILADLRAARHSSQETYAEQLVAWASERGPDHRPLWGGASVLRSPSQFYRRMALLLSNGKPVGLECSRLWTTICRATGLAAAVTLAVGIGVPTPSVAEAENETGSAVNVEMLAGQELTLDEIGLDDSRPAMERYRDAIKTVAAYVERLKQAGDAERAEKVAATLAKVQRDFDSPQTDAISAETPPEVHVVSILRSRANQYDRALVNVEVTNTACPTILVLVGYQPTKWNFSVKPGVQLQKVIKGQNTGRTYEYQGLPTNIPILTAPSADGSSLEPFDDRFRPLHRRDAVAAIYKATGLPVSTVLRYGDDGEARIVVGPENADWRAQRAASALAALRGEAEQAERDEYRAKLRDLRIESLFKVYRGGYSHDPQFSVSFGTLTIDGPEWETFRPVSSKLRCLSRSADGALYGIYGSVAAIVDPKLPKPTPLLLDGEPVQVGDVRAMTVHHRTGELIAWGNSLYKCDLSTGVWSIHPKPDNAPTAAVYSPARGVILGVEADHTANGLGSRAIVRVSQYNKNGERIATADLSRPILVDPNSEGGVELSPAGEYLAIVRRDFARYRESEGSRPFPSRLFILEPDDGRILWTAAQTFSPELKPGATVTLEKPDASHDLEAVDSPGPVALANRQIEGQHLGFIGPTMFDPRSVTERLARRYEDIEKAISALPESNPNHTIASKEFASLKKLATGDYSDLASDNVSPELHVVSVQKGTAIPLKSTIQVDVAVSYTKRPIELALLAEYPLQWNLKIGDGVTIKRIILGGYKEGSKISGLDNLAKKPKVEVHEGEQGIQHFDPHRYFNADSQRANLLRKVTGLEIATIIAEGEYNGMPIQVGPANAAWREQHVLYLSTPAYDRLVRPTLEKRWADLSSLRFMSLVDSELSDYFEHVPDDRGYNSSLAKHAPIGPLAGSLVSLDQLLRNIAIDPWSGTVYGTARKGVFTIDRDTGHCSPIASVYGDDPVENPAAIAFDSRRKRLLVWGTDLYVFDPAARKWSAQRHSGQALISAVYSHEDDLIYAVERGTDPNRSEPLQLISRINVHGALVDRIPISHRIWLGLQAPRAQLALADGKLILIALSSRASGGADRGGKARYCFYTLDRKTGEVLWSSESIAVQTKGK